MVMTSPILLPPLCIRIRLSYLLTSYITYWYMSAILRCNPVLLSSRKSPCPCLRAIWIQHWAILVLVSVFVKENNTRSDVCRVTINRLAGRAQTSRSLSVAGVVRHFLNGCCLPPSVVSTSDHRPPHSLTCLNMHTLDKETTNLFFSSPFYHRAYSTTR